jgi:hypothetical protein
MCVWGLGCAEGRRGGDQRRAVNRKARQRSSVMVNTAAGVRGAPTPVSRVTRRSAGTRINRGMGCRMAWGSGRTGARDRSAGRSADQEARGALERGWAFAASVRRLHQLHVSRVPLGLWSWVPNPVGRMPWQSVRREPPILLVPDPNVRVWAWVCPRSPPAGSGRSPVAARRSKR